jgi:hypothetical protein
MMGSKAFESPLISHVRMRALYRALVETRVLGLGRRGFPLNLEACWVATAIDLNSSDLTSVANNWWLLEHVRALGERPTAAAANRTELRTALRALKAEESAPNPTAPLDRLLGAVGLAIAAKKTGVVALAYAAADALTASEWKRVLTVAQHGDLPFMIVATPGAIDLSDLVKRTGAKKVPVVPVDAGDPVAIYRVAQETLVRARHDGGVAVIECIDCGTDPVKLLGLQLVKKKICTAKWVAGVEPAFRNKLSPFLPSKKL